MERTTDRRRRMVIVFAVTLCAGCATEERSTFDLRAPRVYVWTRLDPRRLRDSLQADGVSVEETGEGGGLFVVRGTGTLKWPAVQIVVEEKRAVVNGTEMTSRPGSYRNLIIEEDGRVRPDAFLPFERPPFP